MLKDDSAGRLWLPAGFSEKHRLQRTLLHGAPASFFIAHLPVDHLFTTTCDRSVTGLYGGTSRWSDGRTYIISARTRDASENETNFQIPVKVVHDQRELQNGNCRKLENGAKDQQR